MSCLSEEKLLFYNDHELSDEESSKIENHLLTCTSCKEKLIEIKKTKRTLFNELDYFSSFEVDIPKFVKPKRQNKLFYNLLKAAAAIILLLIGSTYIIPKKQTVSDLDILIHTMYDGQDPNRLWHENANSVIIIDNGNEIIINSWIPDTN